MRKLSFKLFAFLFFPGLLFGQGEVPISSLYLLGGISSPQSDFSSTSGAKSGYAKSGFCGMLEHVKIVGSNANWVTTVALANNATDESALSNQTGYKVTAGSYTTGWMMTGFGLGSDLSSTSGIYVSGQAGILASSFPDITLSSGSSSVTQTTKMGLAFAYGIGAGVRMNNLNIGLRYYSGEPEYEQTASIGGYTSTAKVKLPTTILMFVIGLKI